MMAVPLRERLTWLAGTTVAIGLVDHLTKLAAVRLLAGAPPIVWLGGALRFEYAVNTGAFLSLGASLPPAVRFWLFTLVVGVFLVVVAGAVLRSSDLSRGAVLGMSLLVAGGASNWVDRLAGGGRVVDFVQVGIGPLRTGIFNVADMAITTGFLVLVVGAFFPRADAQPPGSS